MTYVLSIGRNVGNEPMSEPAWRTFKASLGDTCEAFGLSIVFKGEGEGIYEGESEQSYTVVATGAIRSDGSPLSFSASLKILARTFRQEAIALTQGETTFVG